MTLPASFLKCQRRAAFRAGQFEVLGAVVEVPAVFGVERQAFRAQFDGSLHAQFADRLLDLGDRLDRGEFGVCFVQRFVDQRLRRLDRDDAGEVVIVGVAVGIGDRLQTCPTIGFGGGAVGARHDHRGVGDARFERRDVRDWALGHGYCEAIGG